MSPITRITFKNSFWTWLLVVLTIILISASGYALRLIKYKPEIQLVIDTELENRGYSGMYIGSKKSKKYAYPWCSSPERLKLENRVVFKGRGEALAHGFVPTKVCKGLKLDKNP